MSDKIKVAIIGTGHWGPNLLRNFADDPRVEVALVCDQDKARLDTVAAKYRDLKTTTQVSDIVKNSEIQGVVLCTPTNTHYAIGKQILQSGKHLLVEKPMATTSEECESMIRLAEENRVKLMVGHVFLYNSAVQYVKKLVERGELGDLLYVYGKRVNLGPIRKDVNAMWDLAPHDIAIFNYWLGTTPLSAHATGLQTLNPPLHDVVFSTFKYPNNVVASLHVSWLDPRKLRQIVVVGSRKMVVFDDMDPVGPVHIYDKSVTQAANPKAVTDSIQAFKAIVQEGDLVIPKIAPSEPLRAECRAFVDWVLNGTEPLSPGKNGLEVVKVLEAASQSLDRNGVGVNIAGIRPPLSKPKLVATA